MVKINPQAEELNQIIQKDNTALLHMLSEKGKAAYFPKKGIIKQSAEAKGKAINATIGMAMEDDGTPMRLSAIADKIRMDPADVFTYASTYGKPELRKAWRELIYKKNPSLKSRISQPVVTHALTHGLSVAGLLFVDPGDTIIITDKFWGNYRLIFENAYGGVIQTFNTFTETGFDVNSLKAALEKRPGKQIVVLNFPNNPAGYTPTNREVDEISLVFLESAKKGNEIIVILDDAYFGLVFKQNIYEESIFTKLADLHENILAVKLDGATKEDYVWGLRVGFITFSVKGITENVCTAMEEKTAGTVRGSISNASHLSQSLVLGALHSPSYEKEKRSKYALLKTRFDRVEEVLEKHGKRYHEYFTPLPHNSGYFMCIELIPSIDAEEVRQLLLQKYDTGLIASGNLLRIAFSAVSAKTIPVIFENIYNACRETKNM
jgi:aspartate/methionine/tyrosine aminotransferase